jgi:uncharacterized radical SAM superfamily Fe-S cluster-containing enzyme
MRSSSQPLEARHYLIEEYTRTVCPRCADERALRSDDDGVFVDGMLVSHDGSIWMRRFCPAHGESESLYEEDATLWRARKGWATPTMSVVPDRPGNFGGFPDGYRDGLPGSHGQHTCILMLNVTERCNYGCGTCYASALDPRSSVPVPERPTLAEIERSVMAVAEREGGRVGVLMLSGGEPTVRRDLPEIIERMAGLPVTTLMVNTNGRRIARDDEFVELLARHQELVHVYLQFDGLRPSTYRALRGEDVAYEKLKALERLSEAGVNTTLVMTVQRGVNEDEVGDVVRAGLETPSCAGLAIQPAFASGRSSGIDPMSRTTPTGVLRRLDAQTRGLLGASDFIPLPCSHRDCSDIAYLLRADDGKWRSLVKLVGMDDLRKWIHLVANRITFDARQETVAEMLRDGVLQRIFTEQVKVNSPQLAWDIARLCGCVPRALEVLGEAWRKASPVDRGASPSERLFRVTVKMFMDAHTFHEHRIRQCCVHTGTFESDPRRYSFCWRWLFADASDQLGTTTQ